MYYTIYSASSNELLAFGNSVQAAKMIGMSIDVFYCMVSRRLKGKNRKYIVIKENTI